MISRLLSRHIINHNTQLAKLRERNWESESLRNYLQTPLPEANDTVGTAKLIALDFETTGLNPLKDKVLSIGTVDLTIQQIDISSTFEVLLRNEQFVRAETAVVNEILPRHIINDGIEANTAFNQLLDRIAGKVIISHNADIERSFLQTHLKEYFGLQALPILFIDTLKIEKKFTYLGRNNLHASYQLNDLRTHYKLPDYHRHSSASDALACAELFLAQSYKLGITRYKLRQLLASTK